MTQKTNDPQISGRKPEPRELLKNLSSRDFLNLGREQLAYIRPVFIENQKVYAVHKADGTPISILDKPETALAAIHENDLNAITLH